MTARIRCDEQRFLDLVHAGLTNEQVAVEFGVTDRTLCRWRAARPSLNAAINAVRAELAAAKPIPDHGTLRRYRRGCRCDRCQGYNTRRCAENRRRRRAMPIPDEVQHGLSSTYGYYGCRCAACRAANTRGNRPHQRAYRDRRSLAVAS